MHEDMKERQEPVIDYKIIIGVGITLLVVGNVIVYFRSADL